MEQNIFIAHENTNEQASNVYYILCVGEKTGSLMLYTFLRN